MLENDKVTEAKTHIIVFLPALVLLLILPLSFSNINFIITNVLFLLFFFLLALHFYYKKKVVITGTKIKVYNYKGKIFELNYVDELEGIFLSDTLIKKQIGLGDLLIKKTDGSFYEYLYISNGRNFLKNVINQHNKFKKKGDPNYNMETFGIE